MSIHALVRELEAAGVVLEATPEGGIAYRCEEGAFTAELKARVKEARPLLLPLLARKAKVEEMPDPSEPMAPDRPPELHGGPDDVQDAPRLPGPEPPSTAEAPAAVAGLLLSHADAARQGLEDQSNELLDSAEATVAAAAREDFGTFMRFVFGLKPAWFHLEWYRAFQEQRRLLLVSPRDHGKSTSVIGYIIWSLGRNQNLRIKIVAQSDSKATEKLFEIRELIDRNHKLKLVFPNLRPAQLGEWSKHKIIVSRTIFSKDASIEAVGITSTATGGRADLLVYDDIVDLRNAVQMPQVRQSIKQVFRAVWSNMLEPQGKAIYICTLWHTDDLTHELMKNPEWHVVRYDCGVPGDPFRPIWPEKWPREELVRRCREVGTREYGRGFQNLAMTDDEALIPRSILMRCIRRDVRPQDADPKWRRFTGVDLAVGQRKANCKSSIFTIATDERGRRWPIDIRTQRFTSPETARQIQEVHELHRCDIVKVENNGYQQAIIQWMQELNIKPIPLSSFTTTGQNKNSLEVGLPSIRVEFENGGWVIPMGGPDAHEESCDCGQCGWGHGLECACAWCDWLTQIVTYPIGKDRDAIMSMWFAREAAREGHVLPACANMDRQTPINTIASRMGFGGHAPEEGTVAAPGSHGGLLAMPRPPVPVPLELLGGGGGVMADVAHVVDRRRSVWDRADQDTVGVVQRAEFTDMLPGRVLGGQARHREIREDQWSLCRDSLERALKAAEKDGDEGDAAKLRAFIAEGVRRFEARPS